MNIAVNAASAVHVRIYLFCRQVAILYLLDAYVDVCHRGLVFIPQIVEMLDFLHLPPQIQPSQWAVGAALALCVSCEHESRYVVPTPAALSTALGDLLYLARRHAKKTLKLPVISLSSLWYPHVSESALHEITHLASIHFGRAGRVRMASYLATQVESQPTSTLPMLAQLHQYEKDQWWLLMHETMVRLLKAELSDSHAQDAVDIAVHWLRLDAAAALDDASTSVRMFLLQALALNSNDSFNVAWAQVLEPTVVVVQVILDVSLSGVVAVYIRRPRCLTGVFVGHVDCCVRVSVAEEHVRSGLVCRASCRDLRRCVGLFVSRLGPSRACAVNRTKILAVVHERHDGHHQHLDVVLRQRRDCRPQVAPTSTRLGGYIINTCLNVDHIASSRRLERGSPEQCRSTFYPLCRPRTVHVPSSDVSFGGQRRADVAA
jgi:hypothetical protein